MSLPTAQGSSDGASSSRAELDRKVALITSSHRDICASTARQLAAAGVKVMICGLSAEHGRATVSEIRSSGGRANFVLTDVAIAADVRAAIDETIATYGRLDILFNSASRPHSRDGAMLSVSESAWDRIVESTLKGTFFCCQYALPFLQHAGDGIIINLVEQSSPMGEQAIADVCQGGILALTQAIAHQFSNRNVAANLIWHSSVIPALPADKILHGPLESSAHITTATTPATFATVGDAAMYLATCRRPLHGYALLVNPGSSTDADSTSG
ncbi:MAG: SDR family oxidoreductase [Cyanobacteria bacterium J06634_6]